jgi:hypothetical protein
MNLLVDCLQNALAAVHTSLQENLLAAIIAATAMPEYRDVAVNVENFNLLNQLYWTKDDKIWVPDHSYLRYQVFLDNHASILAGHMGRDKTEDLIRRSYYWKGMSRQIEKWIAACRKCHEHKGRQHAKYGLCTPLEVQTRPFWSISFDLISGLPLTPTGHNAIITVVDRFTKLVTLIPCVMAISGRQVAQL